MGDCRYCGENAGLLKNVHRACEERHSGGWSQMVALATQAATGTSGREGLTAELEAIAKSSYVSAASVRSALVQGWETAVDKYLDDNVLSQEEETTLTSYIEFFSLPQADLDGNKAYTHMVQGAVIRDILQDKVPNRVNLEGTLPFNFQRSENLVWVFQKVPYYELRTRRERAGGYSGVSVRVMKGMYYHTGGFKSHSVERTETEHVDTGTVGITTKHIYYAGPKKSFRVPYNKIIAFEPYSDGIGIMRDAASARPQTFVTGDGWFVYNLVTNLAHR